MTTHSTIRDRGATAVEVALILPLILLVAALTVASWRLWQSRADAQSAAQTAARAASVGGSVDDGRRRATLTASAELAPTRCRQPRADVDAAILGTPPGQRGRVTVDVTCTVSMGDLVLPGLPGSFTVRGRALAPADSHRERR